MEFPPLPFFLLDTVIHLNVPDGRRVVSVFDRTCKAPVHGIVVICPQRRLGFLRFLHFTTKTGAGGDDVIPGGGGLLAKDVFLLGRDIRCICCPWAGAFDNYPFFVLLLRNRSVSFPRASAFGNHCFFPRHGRLIVVRKHGHSSLCGYSKVFCCF